MVATALGGKNIYDNLQLLHGHCHDEKTALDLIDIRKKQLSNFLKKLYKE
ncbi:MAG: HNH endonuclease signature motif containing protein [Cyanobacteria bacterium P01_A01_bin.83]